MPPVILRPHRGGRKTWEYSGGFVAGPIFAARSEGPPANICMNFRHRAEAVGGQKLTSIRSTFGLINVWPRFHHMSVTSHARSRERSFPPSRWDGRLPGDRGNGSGGDGAVVQFCSRADAADARCGFGIGPFDLISAAGFCIAFGPPPDFPGEGPPRPATAVQHRHRNFHTSVTAAPKASRGAILKCIPKCVPKCHEELRNE